MRPRLALGYACDFVGYLVSKLRADDFARIEQVMLFGSGARGETTEESDVDLFIEARPRMGLEKRVEAIKDEFESSTKVRDYWQLLGMTLPISLKVGRARDWAVLPAALREHGRVLYGPYRPPSARGRPQALVAWENVRGTNARTNLYRNLFGYVSHGKRYRGLVEELGGRRVSKGAILVPLEHLLAVQGLFRKNRVTCRVITVSEYEGAMVTARRFGAEGAAR